MMVDQRKNRSSSILNFLPEQLHEEVSLLSLSWEPVVGGDGELEENVPAKKKIVAHLRSIEEITICLERHQRSALKKLRGVKSVE